MRPARPKFLALLALTVTAVTATTAAPAIAAVVPEPAAAAHAASAAMSSTAATPMPSMSPPAFDPNLDPGESVTVRSIPPLQTSAASYDPKQVSHHEFQANCTPNHEAVDDPIVFPGMPGASHDHTFLGATTTGATSTTGSLTRSTTSCNIPDDHSAYWFPTLYAGTTPIVSTEAQTIYYKAGITDYRAVRPFPRGLRFVVGSPMATEQQFQQSPGTVVGYECGDVDHKFAFDAFPTACAKGDQLNIRYQAPSCWDGVHLDSADHKSHMAYPVYQHYAWVCPTDHPVAVPMLEFKIHFPLTAVHGDISRLHLASGAGSSWHYDFFNAWKTKTLAAMVTHCITGGLQCDTYGYDGYKPARGRVLDAQHHLLANPAP